MYQHMHGWKVLSCSLIHLVPCYHGYIYFPFVDSLCIWTFDKSFMEERLWPFWHWWTFGESFLVGEFQVSVTSLVFFLLCIEWCVVDKYPVFGFSMSLIMSKTDTVEAISQRSNSQLLIHLHLVCSSFCWCRKCQHVHMRCVSLYIEELISNFCDSN